MCESTRMAHLCHTKSLVRVPLHAPMKSRTVESLPASTQLCLIAVDFVNANMYDEPEMNSLQWTLYTLHSFSSIPILSPPKPGFTHVGSSRRKLTLQCFSFNLWHGFDPPLSQLPLKHSPNASLYILRFGPNPIFFDRSSERISKSHDKRARFSF